MNKQATNNLSRAFFGVTLALFIVGALVLYSASTVLSYRLLGSPSSMILHQLISGGLLGILGFLFFSKFSYHLLEKYSVGLAIIAIISLLLVFIPGLSLTAGGASRWISIGFVNFQPGELAKFAIVVYASCWLARRKLSKHQLFDGSVPLIVISLLLTGLLLKQPDMGTAITLVGSVAVQLIVGGLSLRSFFVLGIIGVLAGFALIQIAPYRAERLQTFLNRNEDPLGNSYQINQSLLAVGSGGVWGYGYGLSRQKHNYLPEPIGDSIFAVSAEELGFVRILGILALFTTWIILGLRIAKNAPDTFSKLLAVGLTSMIGLQALVNICASLGLVPLTGIPLPFFSYGSSALVMTLISSGVLFNIAKHGKNT